MLQILKKKRFTPLLKTIIINCINWEVNKSLKKSTMSLGKLLPVTERSRNYKVTETATVHQRKKTKGPTDQRINDDSSC